MKLYELIKKLQEPKIKQINFKLNAFELEMLENLAKLMSMSIADSLRHIILKTYLTKNNIKIDHNLVGEDEDHIIFKQGR